MNPTKKDLINLERIFFIMSKYYEIKKFYDEELINVNKKYKKNKILNDLNKIIDDKTFYEIKNIGLEVNFLKYRENNDFNIILSFLICCRCLNNKKDMLISFYERYETLGIDILLKKTKKLIETIKPIIKDI